MKKHTLLFQFILSFVIGNVGCIVAASLTIWTLLDNLDSETFAFIMLASLFLMSIMNAKLSYLLDKYSRKQAIRLLNIVLAAMIILSVLVDHVWLYILLSFMCKVYFMTYYTARNSMAQNIKTMTRKSLNATLEVTDQLVAMCASGAVLLLFKPLGMTWMMFGAIGLFLLSAVLLGRLNDAIDHKQQKNKPTQIVAKSFNWYFRQPIAWLVTLTVFPNVVVLLTNTVRPIYLYDVLKLSPDIVAQVSISFSIGALLDGLMSSWFHCAKRVIYCGFLASLSMAMTLANFPSLTMFMLASGTFGFTNSTSRVMFRSLVMSEIDNGEVATFYGLRGSIASGIQFSSLLGMNVAIFAIDSNVVVWALPAVFAFAPLVWSWQVWKFQEKSYA